MQVITEWWEGRPVNLAAVEDPEEPGVWITQRIYYPWSGEYLDPAGIPCEEAVA